MVDVSVHICLYVDTYKVPSKVPQRYLNDKKSKILN